MLIENLISKKNICILSINATEYTISYEIALRYNLNKGKDVDYENFKKILQESEEILCKEYLYNMLGMYRKTEKGYRDKLYEKGYHKQAIDIAIEQATSYGYINDDSYCESYISTYKNKKGKRKLLQELLIKGIKKEIIEKHLSVLESQDSAINLLCDKFVKNKEKTLEIKQKLYRHLLSKGFSYDEINSVINNWYKDGE
jgi:regulatory protein